jgi:predicted GH43/DUF377 family glycosyl hydrolase
MKTTLFAGILLLIASCSGTRPIGNSQGKNWAIQEVKKLDDHNPILEPDRRQEFDCPIRKKEVRWEASNVFNPTAVVLGNEVWLLYRAQDKEGTSRIGIARSKNGTSFKRNDTPVLYPDKDDMKKYEWAGGCEDPRVVRTPDGVFIMTYTAYDGNVARLCVASSRDLLHWEKHGLAFDSKKYRDVWSKSGAIVCALNERNEPVARKINGKYWMYWGDTDIFLASSSDLLDWKPLENKADELVRALSPRPGFFDSRLVEPGPFALWTTKGILLLYNSSNDATVGNLQLPDRTYSVGQAFFDAKNPEKMLARANEYLLSPEKDYEKNGAVNNVCFLEGMVWHQGRWLLYYGTADSKTAVAEVKKW